MPTIFNNLGDQLVRLADLLETCDPGDTDYKYYNKEYKKVAKALMPEMYPAKPRKPTQSIIRTLQKCSCGADGWKWCSHGKYYSHTQIPKGGVQILCKNPDCKRASAIMPTNKQAANSWNDSFKLDSVQNKLF